MQKVFFTEYLKEYYIALSSAFRYVRNYMVEMADTIYLISNVLMTMLISP